MWGLRASAPHMAARRPKTVHPHACGDFSGHRRHASVAVRRYTPTRVGTSRTSLSGNRTTSPSGTPPRVWGLRSRPVTWNGSTAPVGTPPRVWGLRLEDGHCQDDGIGGTPPRVWGLLRSWRCAMNSACERYTPTRVGTSDALKTLTLRSENAVHPHACGDFCLNRSSSSSS